MADAHILTAYLAILQRCLSASVTVDAQVVSSVGKGILVLAAIGPNDTKKDIESMASKLLKMKLWPDEAGLNVIAECPSEVGIPRLMT